ncbi:MAG: hypothetical protein K9W43_01075 [Candidatus Thorarchaeota archaeon]|nr:hypothetical protein [Candidatus Thorarchaeota archaeon]
MNNNRAMKAIDDYLDRVRSYLPMVDESYIVELRTHLIQEAERLGDGSVTEGSALLSVEHMGDPKAVASEYAGSGEKIGPIPVEYVRPFVVLSVMFAGIGFAIAAGWTIASYAFPEVTMFFSGSLLVSLIIIIGFGLSLIIVERLDVIDLRRSVAERTFFERFIGIGADALRKKPRKEVIIDAIMGFSVPIILLLPFVSVLFSEDFLPFFLIIAGVSLFSAFVDIFYYRFGENNVILILEMLANISCVIVAILLVNVFPVACVYGFENGHWIVIDLAAVFTENPWSQQLAFGVWTSAIVIVVMVHIWQTIVDILKVSWYFREGRGLWWHDSL